MLTLWSLRLTYNFYRKGGYEWDTEDYRWPVCRKLCPNPVLFELFNIVFVCVFQNFLLLSLAFPVWALTPFDTPLNRNDFLLAAAFLVFFAMECICDQQQFDFHTAKQVWRLPSAAARTKLMNSLQLSTRVKDYVLSDAAQQDVALGFRTVNIVFLFFDFNC